MPPASIPARIAYLLQMADLSTENGIAKKIHQQAAAWNAAGAQVRIFGQANTPEVWSPPAGVTVALFPKGSPWRRYRQAGILCAAVRAWSPDIIYFRYAYHAPGLPALFRAFPAIAEVNSDDQREYPLTLGPLKNLYHRLTRHRVLSPILGFVPVTRELARVAHPFRRPVEVIANAIRLDSLPALPAPPPGFPVNLVFIGSARTPWHGLERIGELARIFPQWQFHVVGDDVSIWPLVSPQPPPPNLTFHGTLPRDRYLPLVAAATAALGTFGLYRKGMQEACPLKVREYLALGLPVIGACADTDIPEDADYYLRLPNNAAPLAPHRTTIAAFLERWRGRRVPRAAIAHLDTSVKEAARLAFMTRIVSDWRTAHDLPPIKT